MSSASGEGDVMQSSQSTVVTVPDSPVRESESGKVEGCLVAADGVVKKSIAASGVAASGVAANGVVKRKSLSREEIRQVSYTPLFANF
jgi:hypothetical protein